MQADDVARLPQRGGEGLRAFFGADTPIERITPQLIEVWRASRPTGARTKNKQLTILNGIMKRACKVYGLPSNPVAGVERQREVKKLYLDVLEPEEVWALVRAADDELDAANVQAALRGCAARSSPLRR